MIRFRTYYPGISLMTISVFISTLFLTSFSYYVSRSIAVSNRTSIWYYISMLILFAVGYVILSLVSVFSQSRLSSRISYNINKQLFASSQSRYRYHDTKSQRMSSLISNFSHDVVNVRNFFSTTAGVAGSSLILLITISCAMLYLNVLLASLVLLLFPVVPLIHLCIRRATESLDEDYVRYFQSLSKIISRNVAGRQSIFLLNSSLTEIKDFEDVNYLLYKNGLRSSRLTASLMPAFPFFSNIIYLLVLVVGSYLMAHSKLTRDNFAFFLLSVSSLVSPLLVLGSAPTSLVKLLSSIRRINHNLDQNHVQTPESIPIPFTNSIYFTIKSIPIGASDVNLDFNLRITKGEIVAFTGYNNILKSGICNTIFGETSIIKCQVVIDDKLFYTDTIPKIGMRSVKLDPSQRLFYDSIFQNICLGRFVNARQYDDAINAADLATFISTRPSGSNDIILENGLNLSGGQKQRLLIARAILKNPDLLILEDSFSHIDVKTTQRILFNIRRIYPSCTVICSINDVAVFPFDQVVIVADAGVDAVYTHDDFVKSRHYDAYDF